MSMCEPCPSSVPTGIRRRHGLRGTSRFPIRHSSSCSPITTSIRMLYSQGVSLEDLEIGQPELKDARKVWRIFASHYYLFRGTPTRLWLDFAFQELFGLKQRLSEKTADLYFDTISEKLRTPEFLPRALYERFNLEVLATTDSPLDSLADHKAIRESNWKARILPTFRPDPVVDPEFAGFRRKYCKARREDRGRHIDMGGLPERAPRDARPLPRTRLHGNRPWASHRANRESSRKQRLRNFFVE